MDSKLIGYVGDSIDRVRLDLYSDADFAGMASQHSTTGGHLMLAGTNTRFPLTAASKKQQSVSTSTTEAELTTIFHMVRNVAIPAIDLWSTLLHKTIPVNVYEDNQTVNHIIKTGKNQSMRHFERTHRVPVAWLHEIYGRNTFINLQFAESKDMIADLYTKRFTDVQKFQQLRRAVGLAFTPGEIWKNVTTPVVCTYVDWRYNRMFWPGQLD